jgi:hypothetical protein
MSDKKLSHGFVAYPSEPDDIGTAIEEAVKQCNKASSSIHLHTWRHNDIAGRPIFTPIKENIDKASLIIADITTLNLNVTYEIGYAIGKQKRLILIKNSIFDIDNESRRRVGIYETLGYLKYQNSLDLIPEFLKSWDDSPLKTNTVHLSKLMF